MIVPRNISNSEVTTWLTCRQQYYWAFYRNLTPSDPKKTAHFDRGSLGHAAFQRYSEARIDGKSHDASMQYALDVFTVTLKNGAPLEDVLMIQHLFNNYMGFHQGWPDYRILSVEQRFDLPITEDIALPIRYDSLVEHRPTGKRIIRDYKFTYDFWSPDDHALNSQMPKYIMVLRANNHHIDGGELVEIRTRKLSKENETNPKMAWKHTPYYPSLKKQKNMIRQHIAASLEIDEYWNLSDAEREAKTIPVLNKYAACGGCLFRDPCSSKLDGGDPEVILRTAYKENTSYGYNFDEEIKELV